ncbi:MAG: hypothetical protein U9M95_03160 [Candidatus Altiarchaeota archaeon]|nr:hypothetical protein [Candidatus Altiarchaeota archaeon]
MVKKKADYLFEFSWEVCNKVGGIHTVIKSKTPETIKTYHDKYFLVGPYFPDKAVTEFQEKIPPNGLHSICKKLRKEGIVCHFGKWLIPGEPNVILFDYQGFISKNYDIKGELWESYKIDSLDSMFSDFDEPILWGVAAGRFMEELAKSRFFKDKKIVAHFHEWLACGALLHLKRKNVNVATVFTTHGTMLGRAMAGNNVELYKEIDKIDPEKEAYNFKLHSKHQVERVSAHISDVFTTVSEITSMQVENFLKKKPDLLLYNGLNLQDNSTFEQISVDHILYRGKIKKFLEYYFFPYYSFDLDNTLIYFTTGRYEFHNKGFDVFIEALSKLNKELKKKKSRKTIVAFFWVPRSTIRIKPEITHNRAYFEDVEDSVGDSLDDIERRIIRNLISGKSISTGNLFSDKLVFEIKKKVRRFLKEGTPPLCTHDLPGEDKDPMLSYFRKYDLLNRKEDRVKTIFYPIYLTGADGLLDLNYNEAILGSHLGVFPSYYEPWGYTPVETAALGVASITTDYAGFGRYLLQDKDRLNRGIFVIEMFNKKHETKINNLFNCLYDFSTFNVNDRVADKVKAHNYASLVGWKTLMGNYILAHNMAVDRVFLKK